MENIDMNTLNGHSASENMSFSKTDDSKTFECVKVMMILKILYCIIKPL